MGKRKHRDYREPWERQDGERREPYEAFAIYRDMGEERSYPRVAQALSKSLTLIKRWGYTWNWQYRVHAWDDYLDAQALKELERQRIDHRKKLIRKGQRYQDVADLHLTKKVRIDPATAKAQAVGEMSGHEIAKLDEHGVRLERLGLFGAEEAADATKGAETEVPLFTEEDREVVMAHLRAARAEQAQSQDSAEHQMAAAEDDRPIDAIEAPRV